MLLSRQLAHGLRGLLHRNAHDQEIGEEVRQYFDEAVAAHRERGLTEDEARRAARLEWGRPEQAAEQARSYGWENTVRSFVADLHFGARQLARNPGFTIVSAITLALGIGASTAIFSAVDPILFKPLPYPHANRILTIWNRYQGARFELSFGTYRELAQRNRGFESMAIFEPWQPALTGGVQPERLEGQGVSASFFQVLGVAPTLGRDFEPSEDVRGGPRVVILSDRLWQRLFHGDRGILGRPIKLDDGDYTIIGVMPQWFEDVLSSSTDIWTPAQYDTRQRAKDFSGPAWGNHLRLVGRLRPGVTRAQAIEELSQIAGTQWEDFPRPRWASLKQGLIVDSLQDDMAYIVRPALLAVLGAVILVLTIACVNAINLLLARSAQRRGEFGVRAALGASKRRIIRQLITESLLLASFGGAIGLGVAVAGVRVLIALSPPGLPRVEAIKVDAVAFAFAFAVTTLIGLVTGLIPALHVSRGEVRSRLEQSSRRTVGGHAWTRRALVVTEVALALVLLVSAGLLLQSMRRLLAVDAGFNPRQLLTMQVQTSGHRFDDPPSAPGAGDNMRRRFFRQALEAVRQVPGVEEAGFTSLLPLSDDPAWVSTYGARFENDEPQKGRNVFRYAVNPSYCGTMGIAILSGRCIDEHDTAMSPPAAVLSASLARSQFPGQNPIGKRLHVGPDDRPWFVVVGVAGDVKQTSLAINEPDAVYLSTEQTWFADDTLWFVIRARGDAVALAPAVKAAVWSVDKDQPIVRVATMEGLMAITEAQRRFVLILFEAFGLIALVLAAVGLYGVLSGSVAERTREMGVRAALGATRQDLLALILRDGMRLTVLGMALGLLGAAVASRGIVSLLFGTSALDPASWLGMVALLGAIAVLACSVPAWRAARVDPAIALRAE